MGIGRAAHHVSDHGARRPTSQQGRAEARGQRDRNR